MSSLFESFPVTSKEEWVALIHKELKGASEDTLQKLNQVEEIALPAYFHREDAAAPFSDPGKFPFVRGNSAENNDWQVTTCFRIEDLKQTNKEVLNALMAGTTALLLHATSDAPVAFDQLLAEVGLEYIHTTFYPATEEQAKAFVQFMGDRPAAVVAPNTSSWIDFASKVPSAIRPFGINGYAVQQLGATTWQELSIALSEGHDCLVAQLEKGLTADQAAANIHFVLGCGSKYYFEIAKLRAFRRLWAMIVNEYKPSKENSCAAYITVKTGFTTISLKDPYTNLLRQTTQAMSAVLGGVQELVVQPFDWFSEKPNLVFSRRMATNISLLLKEESYLAIVADPSGGSYLLDNLTNDIAERAWSEFQLIERNGGIHAAGEKIRLSEEIKEKAEQFLQLVRDKKETLIGINVFPNPVTVENSWKNVPHGWNNLSSFIVEQQYLHA